MAGRSSLVERRGDLAGVVVTGVTISSLRVQPGDLYVAPAGARAHGARFAADAAAAGAVAVLTDPAGVAVLEEVGVDLPTLVVDRPRAVLGGLAARVYGNPAGRLRLVAVTGTQGKTTTTRLAEAALTTAGVGAAVVGTVGTRVGGQDLQDVADHPGGARPARAVRGDGRARRRSPARWRSPATRW